MFPPILFSLTWITCGIVSYRYFRHLFNDLRLPWTLGNRIACMLIGLTGPAAIVCGLAVDFMRPLGFEGLNFTSEKWTMTQPLTSQTQRENAILLVYAAKKTMKHLDDPSDFLTGWEALALMDFMRDRP